MQTYFLKNWFFFSF